MANVILGIGTSHSPLLANSPEIWLERANDDRRNPRLNLPDGRYVDYDALTAEFGDRYVAQCSLSFLTDQSQRAQAALDRLASDVAAAEPDIVVIIGDDQGEMFGSANMPCVSVYHGESLIMHPFAMPPGGGPQWLQRAIKAYGMDDAHSHPGAPAFAASVIAGLIDRGFDISTASQIKDGKESGFGHAFGFVINRLLGGRQIPVLPVALNTYYPPNVARPSRCYDMGRALRSTIEDYPGDLRIAVIASGGLSHFVTHEPLDRIVLGALKSGNASMLRNIPMTSLTEGSSEILCWVTAAGALETVRQQWSEYLPVYRTPAGTGIGLAFASWGA